MTIFIVAGVLSWIAAAVAIWALARVESSVVALFIYLQPVIASGLAVVLLGDRFGLREVAGALLIFGSVYVVLRPPGRAAKLRGLRSGAAG